MGKREELTSVQRERERMQRPLAKSNAGDVRRVDNYILSMGAKPEK
jgi:hypothetical protein